MTTIFGSCLNVYWLNIPDRGLIARSYSEPAWKYEAGEYTEDTKRAAEKSLKTFHSRHLTFNHYAPAGGGYTA